MPHLIDVLDPQTGEEWRADLTQAQSWEGQEIVAGVIQGNYLDLLHRLPNGEWILQTGSERFPIMGQPTGRRITPKEAMTWFERNGHNPPPELDHLPEARIL